MLSFVSRMKVKEGREAEFIDIANQLMEKANAHEPHTLYYRFFKIRDSERGYAVIESFTSLEAEEAHLETPYFKALVPGMIDCLDGPYTREYMDDLE